jgi:hypothetical protein
MSKAWHIYSTEICEEGIRFVDDGDAQKLVKRSFRLAEIFLRAQPRAGGDIQQQGGGNRREEERDAESAEQQQPKVDREKPTESENDTEMVPTIGEDSPSAADTPDFPE